jgi:hypothetical protein
MVMRTLFLGLCVLAGGAVGCGKADCAEFAKAYCNEAINRCGVPCTESVMQNLCTTLYGTTCDMGPCIDEAKSQSCNEPTLNCTPKC